MQKIIAITILSVLSACAQAPEAFKAGPLAFERQQGITRMSVNEIRVVNHYQSPMKRPNIEQEFPVTPASAVNTWVSQRLRATPGSNQGILEVTIHDASVIEQSLPKTEGFKGLITDDQDARYVAKLTVSFKHYPAGSSAANATGDVTVSRTRTVNERATVSEREAIFHQMTNALITDFEREANARLRQYFGAYIR